MSCATEQRRRVKVFALRSSVEAASSQHLPTSAATVRSPGAVPTCHCWGASGVTGPVLELTGGSLSDSGAGPDAISHARHCPRRSCKQAATTRIF
jgi:hypothetical protein